MSETPKDDEKSTINSRRYHETIADLKKHQEAERLKDELAREYERGSK